MSSSVPKSSSPEEEKLYQGLLEYPFYCLSLWWSKCCKPISLTWGSLLFYCPALQINRWYESIFNILSSPFCSLRFAVTVINIKAAIIWDCRWLNVMGAEWMGLKNDPFLYARWAKHQGSQPLCSCWFPSGTNSHFLSKLLQQSQSTETSVLLLWVTATL